MYNITNLPIVHILLLLTMSNMYECKFAFITDFNLTPVSHAEKKRFIIYA